MSQGEERPEDEAARAENRADGADQTRRDQDAAWAEIVANFGDRAVLDEDESGFSEDDDAAEDPPERAESGSTGLAETGEPPGGWFAAEPIDLDHEERYEPPEPPPLPRTSPDRALAWFGALGVPVLTVVLVVLNGMIGLPLPGWVPLLLAAGFLGGLGYLIATMPKGPDDPWDDGARV